MNRSSTYDLQELHDEFFRYAAHCDSTNLLLSAALSIVARRFRCSPATAGQVLVGLLVLVLSLLVWAWSSEKF